MQVVHAGDGGVCALGFWGMGEEFGDEDHCVFVAAAGVLGFAQLLGLAEEFCDGGDAVGSVWLGEFMFSRRRVRRYWRGDFVEETLERRYRRRYLDEDIVNGKC